MTLPDLITLPNGNKTVPTFSASEMEGRLDRLRQAMAQEGVDAGLFTSYHNKITTAIFCIVLLVAPMVW